MAARRPRPSSPGKKRPVTTSGSAIPRDPRSEPTTETQHRHRDEPTSELVLSGGRSANRRKNARIPIRVWAENRGFEEFCLWLAAEDISQDFAFCYRTTDLSAEGLFLETTMPLDVGVEMDLTFRLPGSERVVHAFGEVVRVVKRGGKSPPGMAVAFREIDEASKASLDAFLISRG